MRREKILTIDDDSDILDVLAITLSDNYDVISAPNGKEGLDMVRAKNPDLIITGFCPDHPRSKALPSIAKYQEIEFDEEGNEKYSKYFCSGKDNGTGKNHSLWRRQVIPAEPF